MIYLDNAATTFPKPENVYKKMDLVNRNYAVNAGRGSYNLAKKADEEIEKTKKLISNLVNGGGSSISFTPSISIALNQILFGLDWSEIKNVYVSPFEHNAVIRVLYAIKRKKFFNIIEISLEKNSLEIDINKMIYEFSKNPPNLICLNAMSNVSGYILPYEVIFSEGKRFNSLNILDTAQALGLVKIDMQNQNIDILAFAGHKSLYGPFGVGGVVVKPQVTINAILAGGTGSDSLNVNMPEYLPNKLEFASKNIVAIAGLGAALELTNYEQNFEKEKELAEYFISEIEKISEVILYLPKNLEYHNSIISFNIEDFKANEVGNILNDDFDIAVRTGYHCAPLIHKYLNDEKFLGTVRVGIGMYNSKKEIDILVNAIVDIINE